MDNCSYCDIINKRTPAKIYYEDDDVVVFPSPNSTSQVDLIIATKQHISDTSDAADPATLLKLFTVARNMISREGMKDKGYKITLTGGGAQVVDHLAVELTGPITNIPPALVE